MAIGFHLCSYELYQSSGIHGFDVAGGIAIVAHAHPVIVSVWHRIGFLFYTRVSTAYDSLYVFWLCGTLWVFVLMLLQDIVCFIFFSWTGTLSIPFKQWLYTFGFFSWILNGLLLLGLEYVLGVMDRYTMIRQNRILKMERSRYKKLRFMRK